MKEKLDIKTLAVIVLPIAAMALGYFLFFHTPESTEAPQEITNSIPIPSQESEELSENKSEIYNHKTSREMEEENKRRRSNVSERDFYNLIRSEEETPQVIETEEIPEVPQVIEKEDPVQVQRPREKKDVVYVEKEAAKEVEPTPTKPAPIKGGFGITMNTSQPQSQSIQPSPSGSSESNKGFIAIILEESLEIKTGTSVVFICGQDFWHQGQKINRNALLFGKARDMGSVFEIQIEQIKNTNGQMIAATNLVVYDERYSRGLAHSGALNKAVKEGANQTTTDISRDASRATGVGSAGALAVNALDRTLSSMTRQKQRENSVSLQKGYRIYAKQID